MKVERNVGLWLLFAVLISIASNTILRRRQLHQLFKRIILWSSVLSTIVWRVLLPIGGINISMAVYIFNSQFVGQRDFLSCKKEASSAIDLSERVFY